MNRRDLLALGLSLGSSLMLASPALSSTAKEIDWLGLAPDLPPLVDPLAHLTPDQRYAFDEILLADGISTIEANRKENAGFLEETNQLKKVLERSGIDVQQLLAKVKAYDAEIQARGSQMRTSLDGKRIRMAGYLLPLNFSEKGGETEFLLVPYVGACVHVPPPPPNQLVYVTTAKPVKVKSVFTPVWVTGKIRIEKSTRQLGLADGVAPVSVGYAMLTENVTEYKDKPKRGSSG